MTDEPITRSEIRRMIEMHLRSFIPQIREIAQEECDGLTAEWNAELDARRQEVMQVTKDALTTFTKDAIDALGLSLRALAKEEADALWNERAKQTSVIKDIPDDVAIKVVQSMREMQASSTPWAGQLVNCESRVAEAKKPADWISTDDQPLPADMKHVLVIEDTDNHEALVIMDAGRITHWLRLPKWPKEAK